MKLKFFLRLIGPVIFIILFYIYIDVQKLINILRASEWEFFIAGLALNPPLIFIRSIRWRIILSKYDILYTRRQCFKIYFVEMVAIMVIAAIGTFVKAVYLKRDGHGLLQPLLSIFADKYYVVITLSVYRTIYAISNLSSFSKLCQKIDHGSEVVIRGNS